MRWRCYIGAIALGLAPWLPGLVRAIDNQPPFSEPELQHRYREMIGQVRCLVCQNLAIADSNEGLARDLRREIHEMIAAGRTDDEIIGFLVARYGDSILYRTPVQANTGPLWAAPIIFIIAGIGVFAAIVNKRRGSESEIDE